MFHETGLAYPQFLDDLLSKRTAFSRWFTRMVRQRSTDNPEQQFIKIPFLFEFRTYRVWGCFCNLFAESKSQLRWSYPSTPSTSRSRSRASPGTSLGLRSRSAKGRIALSDLTAPAGPDIRVALRPNMWQQRKASFRWCPKFYGWSCANTGENNHKLPKWSCLVHTVGRERSQSRVYRSMADV